ncbi:type IV toxin-antitoxin system AbiEi family antitoxin domain-containing protein [Thermanaerothrix daxensis]|uniref:type IV toxin-antitoxin system AbiEi family antitoxin domain-containing protein n=1 Tax=Thermanaerothrix daxensis TaxID=869279 RepID=UPI002682A539
MTDPQHPFPIAENQVGYFTTLQAYRAGFSYVLLGYDLKTGQFLRLRRGVYRLPLFPRHAPCRPVHGLAFGRGKGRVLARKCPAAL